MKLVAWFQVQCQNFETCASSRPLFWPSKTTGSIITAFSRFYAAYRKSLRHLVHISSLLIITWVRGQWIKINNVLMMDPKIDCITNWIGQVKTWILGLENKLAGVPQIILKYITDQGWQLVFFPSGVEFSPLKSSKWIFSRPCLTFLSQILSPSFWIFSQFFHETWQ